MDFTFKHPLFDNYPDPVFSLDLEGNFTGVNEAVVRLAECSREELMNMSFRSFVPAHQIDTLEEIFREAAGGQIRKFETELISSKGTHRVFTITNIPIISNDRVTGVYAIAQDITEKRAAEKLGEEFNQRVSVILESITDAFFAIDQNWTVTYWSRESEHLTGVSRSEVLGKNLWSVFKEAVALKFYEEYSRVLREKVSRRFIEYFPPVGKWFEVTANPSAEGVSVFFRDITRQQQHETELREAKERYRELFDLSPLPKWVFDVHTLEFLEVNQAAIRKYGYSKEEFLSMTLRDIRSPFEAARLARTIKEEIKKNVTHAMTVKHIKKNGEEMIVRVEGISVAYEGRDARMVVAIDETARIKAKQSVFASERRFKALLKDGSDLISIIDKQGYCLYMSPNSEEVLKLKPADLISQPLNRFIHEDDREKLGRYIATARPHTPLRLPPFRVIDGEGRNRWMEMILTDMSEDPAIGGIITNARDITRRIRDEQKTRESIERFNIVSEATSDVIWDWDMRTGQMIWNKGIREVFGYQIITSRHDWWYRQVHPDDLDEVITQFEQAVKNRELKLVKEYRFRCADGSYKHLLDRSYLIFNEHGEVVRMIGSMQDISSRIEYIRSIEAQNSSLREIAWMQSHLVRAPLARIMAISDLIYDPHTDEALKEELLTHLKSSSTELDEVIRQVVQKADEMTIPPIN